MVVEAPDIFGQFVDEGEYVASSSSEDINRRARLAQIAVGVDPRACIRMADIASTERTPVDIYLTLVHWGLHPLPEDNPDPDSWHNHDMKLHAPRVSELHPEPVVLARAYAGLGLNFVQPGKGYDLAEAERIAEFLDFHFFFGELDKAAISAVLHATRPAMDGLSVIRESFRIEALQREHARNIRRAYLGGISSSEVTDLTKLAVL